MLKGFLVRVVSECERAVKGVRGGLGGRCRERGAAAAEGDVECGEISGDGAGPGGGDDGGLGLLEEPLDGLSVGLVTQFPGQLENPSSTGGGHSDSAAAAVNLGMPVLGGSLGGVGGGGGRGDGGGELLGLVGGIIRSGGDGQGGIDDVGRS